MERPTPELNLSMDVKEKQRECTRHFTSTSYGKQELAFRGHNERVESDNRGNYIEYLSSLSEFDHLLASHLESSTVFRGTSPAIHNDLIFAISGVMIKNTKSEIEEAPFAAIVVDETIYARVLAHTDVLYNILQTKSLDIAYCLQEVSKLKNTIFEFRRSGFPSIWSKMENENSSANTMEPPLKRRKGDDELKYRQLCYSILDRMHMEITDRFSDYGKLQFTYLLNSQKFSAYRENFPNEALNKLFQSYNSHFDQVRLKNELSVIYSAEVFDFSNKPIHEILSAIYENQLNQVIPEVLKLATLIVTIPATSPSVERTFSALKRIKSYCRSTHTQERLSGLALMSIEKKIFGAKRDEVTGEWRKLHNTELHALYSSPDIIKNIKSRRLRWAGHVARMGESRNACRVLVGRPEGKKPLGRRRRRWEDNIKMNLREVGYDDRDWINLAQDRDRWRAYMRAAMNLRLKASAVDKNPPGRPRAARSPENVKRIQQMRRMLNIRAKLPTGLYQIGLCEFYGVDERRDVSGVYVVKGSNHQLRMNVYTFPELADMVMCYGEARGNGRRALHMYQQQFQNRNHPHHTMFTRLYQRLRDDGSLRPRHIGGRPRRHPFSIDDYTELEGKGKCHVSRSLTIRKNSWNRRLGRIVNSLAIQKNSWNRRLGRIVNSLAIQKNSWNRRLGRIVNSLTIQKDRWNRRLRRIVDSLTIQKNIWNRSWEES
ncbi:hypothetical protein ANN_12815 [Periplaneta americana]|uniref:HAT C-terminal dimerisation domain-containing protein n=1 Tax=Periplaneta americana TaxID=6978 RepID=A0ABQ8TIM8_PERAM|nr:hypothetical protein ANN_12815 [Periplaneta americana]